MADEDDPYWDGEERESPPNCYDDRSRLQILAEECATCIFRTGNLMQLRPGRLRQLVADTRRSDSFVVCHSTLARMAPEGVTPAMCRGYYDRYGGGNAARVMGRIGGIVEVPAPDPEQVRLR